MTLRTRSPKVCETHQKHATWEEAHREVCRQFEKYGRRLVAFPSNKKKPCACGYWHVGHLRRGMKEKEG